MLLHQVALVSDTSTISFGAVSKVSAALQKQATRDFGPVWDVPATVDAFPTLEDVPIGYWPIILRDDIQDPNAAGYHTDDNGQPFSLVQASGNWPLTASHECLEMLADPFGNRTVAGAPPAQATGPAAQIERVEYLVEVCDPCESEQFAYPLNTINLSDFITPNYYDPNGNTGVQYSFRGNIRNPHDVLDGGYISFGDPATNEWFQVVVQNGQAQTVSLGVLNTQGGSMREAIDAMSRAARRGYRVRSATTMAAAAGSESSRSTAGRAQALRRQISKL